MKTVWILLLFILVACRYISMNYKEIDGKIESDKLGRFPETGSYNHI